MRKSEWVVGLGYVGVLALLALAGQWARRGAEPGCAHDGLRLEPIYRVRVVDAGGHDRLFCCVRCARAWLGHEPTPRAIRIPDEASGQEIDADAAIFVRSLVVTNPTTGNRVHAFRSRADAEEHARASRGQVLDAPEYPFGPGTSDTHK